jgi:hypothetical protein
MLDRAILVSGLVRGQTLQPQAIEDGPIKCSFKSVIACTALSLVGHTMPK